VNGEDGLWVFGYGSLMWRPGFSHDERVHAVLSGGNRALCLYSYIHRGSPIHPGLVLGLDAGGRCEGIAFHVPPRHVNQTLNYLRRRELMNNVYRPVLRTVALGGRKNSEIQALCYMVNRNHRQYAGHLPLEMQEWLVRRGRGHSGRNIDYVVNTVRHLRELAIFDMKLEALLIRLGRHRELGGCFRRARSLR
jgi:cation transport protein ChaC